MEQVLRELTDIELNAVSGGAAGAAAAQTTSGGSASAIVGNDGGAALNVVTRSFLLIPAVVAVQESFSGPGAAAGAGQ